jgi:hypothetical protein
MLLSGIPDILSCQFKSAGSIPKMNPAHHSTSDNKLIFTKIQHCQNIPGIFRKPVSNSLSPFKETGSIVTGQFLNQLGDSPSGPRKNAFFNQQLLVIISFIPKLLHFLAQGIKINRFCKKFFSPGINCPFVILVIPIG